MSKLLNALLLGGYSLLIIPAIILILAAFLDRSQYPDQPSRRKLLIFLSVTALVTVLLGLLIWFNPYGREISSSLSGYGVLIVLVTLLTYLFSHWRYFYPLWDSNKKLISFFIVLYLLLFSLLWFVDHITFYLVAGLPLALVLAWTLARSGFSFLIILGILSMGILVINTGGAFFIPANTPPVWINILTVAALLFSIFLPAGVFYVILRGAATVKKSQLLWGLVLALIFLAGVSYQMYWDGIWSSAHDRAFEDHLPFAHFLFSMLAGVMLTLTLRGSRRWMGPIYILLVTSIAVLMLTLGWGVSAFEMTERRAAVVNNAINDYDQENGVYPASLAELSPRYLLFLPPPVIVRTGGWCYQSGDEFYRLGYISGDFTYFDRDFKIETHAQVGDMPASSWNCDELLAKFNLGELIY
jgi:hypothetical protein